MATGQEAVIADLLFARLAALITTPATEVALPNADFSGSKPYLDVSHLPNRSTGQLLDATKDLQGFLQVTVVHENGYGLIDPYEIASQVIAHFPVTLVLGTTVRVRFVQPGFVGPPIQEGQEFRVPVSIPYRASI